MKTIEDRTRWDVEARIAEYCNMISDEVKAYWLRMGYTSGNILVSAEYGSRYAKVKVGSQIHTFIDLSNGDILKAATYKAPAKNGVRGNIFADDLGRSVVNQYGAKYLR